MPAKEGKNVTLSYTLRKRKHTLASLMISIFIHLLQKRKFCFLGMRHLFPSILGATNFQTDVHHIKCWLERIRINISITQHFCTILKWIEFLSTEEKTLNHMFRITSRIEWDVLHSKSQVTNFAAERFPQLPFQVNIAGERRQKNIRSA